MKQTIMSLCCAGACVLGNIFDFQRDASGWEYGNEFSYAEHGGRNGSGGLVLTRADSRTYTLASHPVSLEAGKRYKFGGWIKTADVRGADNGASLALEFYRLQSDGKRQYITGEYLTGIKGTRDWQKVSGNKVVPLDANYCCVSLYLRRGMTGKAWFDDIFVEPAEDRVQIYGLRSRLQARQPLELRVLREAEPIEDGMTLEVSFGGRSSYHEIRNGQVILPLHRGNGILKATCYNSEGKKLGVSNIRLWDGRGSDVPVSAGHCELDGLGRILVDGEPFMPIGIFTAGVWEEDMRLFKDAGINMVMPYSTFNLRPNRNDKPGKENLRKVLDCLHRYGIKVTPSLKDTYKGTRYALTEWEGVRGCDKVTEAFVRDFRNHPAILGYFINDELPTSQLSQIQARREQINHLDPLHPTWSVQYQFEELPMYGGTADILAVDPYPITRGKNNSMRLVDTAMMQLKKTGLPCWGVPQIMSFAAYHAKNPAEAKAYPSPTSQEMRSMFLLMAGYGAKGFVLYKYEDLKHWTLPPDNFHRRWPDVVSAVNTLRELEPFIMSRHPVEMLDVQPEAGTVRVFLFRNDAGKRRIVCCALGPGKAVVTLPVEGKARSWLNKTRMEEGKLVFRGFDIDCDILDLE